MRATRLKCAWWVGETGIKTYRTDDDGRHLHTDTKGNTIALCEGPLISAAEAKKRA